MIGAAEREAVGVTVEGIAVGSSSPRRVVRLALVRATGAAAYVSALEPLPDAPDEPALYDALGVPWCPPELREEPFSAIPRRCRAGPDPRRPAPHTTWSDGRQTVEEMGRAARERGYEYLAICDHTPAVGAVRGLTAR